MTGERRPEVVRTIAFTCTEYPAFGHDVRTAAGGSADDALVSTLDPQRVYVFTAEWLLPAFVIDGVARYRDAYNEKEPDEREQYHLDRTWMKDLVDLMPVPEGKQSGLDSVDEHPDVNGGRTPQPSQTPPPSP